ncbi:MAG: phage portal protein [Candidatus Hodarchaeota archaeon]
MRKGFIDKVKDLIFSRKANDTETTRPERKTEGTKGEISEVQDYSKKYRQRKAILTYAEMQEYYEKDEWIRACVDEIVKNTVKVRPYIAAKDEEGEPSEETKKHMEEIEALLSNPNEKDESFESIRRKVLTDILKFDAGAVEIVYDTAGKPAELYDLPGHLIRLNVDKHGCFDKPDEAYAQLPINTLGSGKEIVYFKQKEVIYFIANPQSGSVYGLSPLESLVNSVEADLNASEYNASFFENNAEPSGIVQVGGLSKAALKRFKTYWKQQFKGPKKAHKILALNAKTIDFKKISESQKDMQFMEYQKWLLQKILSVYKVKPFVLGIIDETTGKLNSAEQWNAFKEAAIDPLLSLESYLYTTKLIQAGFGYDDVELRFEEQDIRDEKQTAEIVEKLVKSGVLTINEARRIYYGLDKVDYGDSPFLLKAQSAAPIAEEKPIEKVEEKQEEKPSEDLDRISDKIREILEHRNG